MSRPAFPVEQEMRQINCILLGLKALTDDVVVMVHDRLVCV